MAVEGEVLGVGRGEGGEEFLEDGFDLEFEVFVTDDKGESFVPTDQHDLLVDSCVQFVETLDHVSQIDERSAVVSDLVEDKVPEQSQHVSVSRFIPPVIRLKSTHHHTTSKKCFVCFSHWINVCGKKKKERRRRRRSDSGRSLMKLSLEMSRNSLPFSTSFENSPVM